MFLEMIGLSEYGRAMYYTGWIDMWPPLRCMWGDINAASL